MVVQKISSLSKFLNNIFLNQILYVFISKKLCRLLGCNGWAGHDFINKTKNRFVYVIGYIVFLISNHGFIAIHVIANDESPYFE